MTTLPPWPTCKTSDRLTLPRQNLSLDLSALGDYTDIAWKTRRTQQVLALLRKQRDVVVATRAD